MATLARMYVGYVGNMAVNRTPTNNAVACNIDVVDDVTVRRVRAHERKYNVEKQHQQQLQQFLMSIAF